MITLKKVINKLRSSLFQVIMVFLVLNTIFLGYFLYKSFHNLRDSFRASYPLIDISREFILQSNFIVNIVPLKNDLEAQVAKATDFNISLYTEFLNTGSNIAINSNTQIFPASLAKLPLAMIAMNMVENKDWALTDKLEIKAEDIDSRSGVLSDQPTGTKESLDDTLTYLLRDSDNTAQRVLLDHISSTDAQDLIDALGLENLFSVDGKMSSKEYTRLFRALYYSSYLIPSDSQKLLTILNQATFKDYLSRGIPSNVIFPHKYGEDLDNQIFYDSGIIYLQNRPIMITVMMQAKAKDPNNKDKAASIMGQISKSVYDYFKNQ